MGAPTFEGDPTSQGEVHSFGFVDYVLSKLGGGGLHYRELAVKAGLSKSRAHNVFHPDPTKRRPLYIYEYHAVAAALDLSPLEAALVSNLYSSDGAATEGIEIKIKFFSELLSHFHEEMEQMMERLTALEWADVRPSHGALIIRRLMADVEDAYADVADRKELRRLRDQELE
jgi:hypothetical protein